MSAVRVTASGFEVDAEILAAAFALDPAAVQDRLRSRAITSQCETGLGEDAGRFRLSFRHAGRVLRLTVDAEGRILSRAAFPARAPGPGPQ